MADGIKSETQVKAEPSEASPPEAHVHGMDKIAVLKPDDEDARQFTAEYAKSNRSTCQYSKCPRDGYIEKGEVRLGKLVNNPFVDDPDALMARWYHVPCLFESFNRGTQGRKTIQSKGDIQGFEVLDEEDRHMIEQEMIGHRTTAEAFINAKADDTEYLEYIGERDGEMEEKFWEITRAGASTRVRYGPIGAEGFVLVKNHSDEPSAAKFMADKVREKLEKVGYHRLDSDDARHQHDQAIRDYKRSRTAVKAENALKQENSGSSGTASSDTEPEGSEEKQGGEKDDAEQSQVSGFLVDYAKSDRSTCRYSRCKDMIDKGELRIAKLVHNVALVGGHDMSRWYHVNCFFTSFQKGPVSSESRLLRDVSQLQGFEQLRKSDQERLRRKVAAELSTQQTLSQPEQPLRRFAYDREGEQKIWEIGAEGKRTITKWGSPEGRMFQQLKVFDSAAEAKQYLRDKVTEKLRKGYVELGLVKAQPSDSPSEQTGDDADTSKTRKRTGVRKRDSSTVSSSTKAKRQKPSSRPSGQAKRKVGIEGESVTRSSTRRKMKRQ